jgi:5-methylcytosine-specific restriction endonuclease McrA
MKHADSVDGPGGRNSSGGSDCRTSGTAAAANGRSLPRDGGSRIRSASDADAPGSPAAAGQPASRHGANGHAHPANGDSAAANGNGSLNYSVLVLNRFYMAVHVVNVRRAFCLLFRELADVIDVEEGRYANYDFQAWQLVSEIRGDVRRPDDDWIRAVSFDIQVPRVIRLLHYDRVPRHTLRFNRRNLFARDGHRCQYCGRGYSTSHLSIDHVVPRSRGGLTTWENVVCCCVTCNVKKGGRTPQEARMALIRQPARPKHSPLLALKLTNPKYESWRTFVESASWSVDVA